MLKLQESERIKTLEDTFNCRADDLLYQLHWGENMMHSEIADITRIPRPTITRWFHQLDVPTQSCRRFTDQNLTSWLYKTGQLKKKPAYNGPDRRLQRTKAGINVDFFKTWSAEMAYVLGYFAADGCMYENSGKSKYLNFVSTDYELLEKIKEVLRSKHNIMLKRKMNNRCKEIYWLQIGSKDMYNDLSCLGLTPKKDIKISFPEVPDKCLRHFVRGYFDGDGCVTYGWYTRKNRKNNKYFYFQVKFACGDKTFLTNLSDRIAGSSDIGHGSISGKSNNWQLSYSKTDATRFFDYMYTGVSQKQFLKRKHIKFQEALKICGGVA